MKPAFTEVVAGKWWAADDNPDGIAELSVAEAAAKLLNLHVGSTIVWTTPQRTFTSKVAAIHQSESVRLTARIDFFLTPEALEGLPAIYYGGIRATAASVPAIQKAIYDRFPTITVVNMADVLDTIQSVVDQISLVVRFISAFSILAGAIILASSVAGHALPAHPRSGDSEDAGRDEKAHRADFLDRVSCDRHGGGIDGRPACGRFRMGCAESSAGCEKPARSAADARRDRGHRAAGHRDRLAGQFPHARPEAAGDSEGRMKPAALFLLAMSLLRRGGRNSM